MAPLISLLVGILLFLGGTDQWMLPARYISSLLPAHQLEIRAVGAQGPRNMALSWFTTSVGDVSYGSMEMKGWERVGDELVLEQPDNNSIQWQGRTGGSAELIFRSAAPDQTIRVSWDGHEELLKPATGKFTYNHDLPVPWYVSSAFVYLLGIMVLASLALGVCLLLWPRRTAIAADLRASVMAHHAAWNRKETLFLLGAALVALLLRLVNLGRAYPAVDEYFHLIAARQIAEGAPLGSVYGRALWMVSVPVSLAFRAFGFQLWAARLVGAVVNVLGVWPLYLLGRKINQPIAVLSVLLYVTSPWVVTFARITREYAYYPVFAYWVIIGMVSFIPRIPNGFVLVRDWKMVLQGKTLLIGLALLLPPVFAFFIDPLSTFRVMMIAYIVLAVFVLARFDWTHRLNLPVLLLIGIGALAAGYAAYTRDAHRIVPAPRFNAVPIAYFFPNPPQQWYFGRVVMVAAICLIAVIACSYLLRRLNFIPLFMVSLFATYLAFFTFLSKKFFHTRHLTTTELWYILLLAAGLYFAWRVLRQLRPWRVRGVTLVAGAVVALSLTNVGQILLPATSTNPNDAISEDYLHDMSKVHAYLLTHVQPNDVLISTVYGLYNSWVEAPRFQANYRITTQTPVEQILGMIDQHETGWIVIDQIRLDMSPLGPRAFAANPDVEYIGLFGDQNVWHWQHAPGAAGTTMVAGKAK